VYHKWRLPSFEKAVLFYSSLKRPMSYNSTLDVASGPVPRFDVALVVGRACGAARKDTLLGLKMCCCTPHQDTTTARGPQKTNPTQHANNSNITGARALRGLEKQVWVCLKKCFPKRPTPYSSSNSSTSHRL
jgi:hypothetical protein